MPPCCPDPLVNIVRLFNGLAPDKLDMLGDVYSPGIEFRDPLHQVKGIPGVRHVFEQMFRQLGDLTVSVIDSHGDERTGFLLWEMRYTFRGAERTITGTSHLRFAADGRVAAQSDHWDASFAVYGEFPMMGLAMRGIRRLVAPRPKP